MRQGSDIASLQPDGHPNVKAANPFQSAFKQKEEPRPEPQKSNIVNISDDELQLPEPFQKQLTLDLQKIECLFRWAMY